MYVCAKIFYTFPLWNFSRQDINFRVDYAALETFLVDMYNNNELHLRDIHDYVQLAAEEITARLIYSITYIEILFLLE